jgi:hypothetical protein
LWVSGSFFDALGVKAALGRTLSASDDQRNGGADGPVAVISDRFWRGHFNGAADVAVAVCCEPSMASSRTTQRRGRVPSLCWRWSVSSQAPYRQRKQHAPTPPRSYERAEAARLILGAAVCAAVAYEPPSRFVDGGTIFFMRK